MKNKKESSIQEVTIENNEPVKKPRGKPFMKGNKFGCTSRKGEKKGNINDYILRSTQNGKLMADFYIGVLNAIKANTEGVKMVYNGVPITVELAKSANDWLTNNSIGKPSVRDKPEKEEPRLNAKEQEAELKMILNSAGLKLVDIDSPSPERNLHSFISRNGTRKMLT